MYKRQDDGCIIKVFPDKLERSTTSLILKSTKTASSCRCLLYTSCIAIEDEYGNTPAQRAELDWLLYNKPLEYAQIVLKGEMGHYLSLGCDHGRLED